MHTKELFLPLGLGWSGGLREDLRVEENKIGQGVQSQAVRG